jgi:HK97 family phage major capsid protein
MKNNAVPKNSEELSEYLGDTASLRADLDSGKFASTITNYIQAQNEAVTAQVTEQVQMVQAELAKQGLNIKAPVNYSDRRPQTGTVYNKNAHGAALDGKFDDMGEYVQSVLSQHSHFRNANVLAAKLQNAREVTNSFGSEVPDAGGFLIPEEFRGDMLQWSLENSIVRPRATVIPMSTLRVNIPIVDDTTHVSSVFGGITAYWEEEAATLTESQASFGRITLDAKKFTIYCEIPNELLADAQALNGWLGSQLPKALAWHEDVAFLTGSGAGQPEGVVGSPGSVSVSARSGQTAGSIIYENLVDMYSRMLPQSLPNSVWVAAIDTFPQLATMSLSVGTGGSALFVGNGTPANAAAGTPPMTILGRPVIFTEKVGPLASKGDINLIDFGFYLLGDRQAMTADSSPHFKFSSDKTAFRLIERVDGRPWIQTAITAHNNSSNTLSPYVNLAAR